MSLEPLQVDIANILKALRSPDSFVGGSTVFNRDFPRRSADMDVYVESRSISEVASMDVEALRARGLAVELREQFYGLVIEAKVSRGNEATLIEWNEADRERFFPVAEDALFGWTLHPADLAIQKLVAAASRREARDIVDILLLHRLYVPLSALAIAAPAKLSGTSPTRILDRALRNGIGLRQEDYDQLALDRERMPFSIETVKLVLSDSIAGAVDQIVTDCADADAGYVYCLPGGTTIQVPIETDLPKLERRGISERGLLPVIDRAGQWSSKMRP